MSFISSTILTHNNRSLTSNISHPYILILPQFETNSAKFLLWCVPLFSQTRLSFCWCWYTIVRTLILWMIWIPLVVFSWYIQNFLLQSMCYMQQTNKQTNKQARVRACVYFQKHNFSFGSERGWSTLNNNSKDCSIVVKSMYTLHNLHKYTERTEFHSNTFGTHQ